MRLSALSLSLSLVARADYRRAEFITFPFLLSLSFLVHLTLSTWATQQSLRGTDVCISRGKFPPGEGTSDTKGPVAGSDEGAHRGLVSCTPATT